MQRIYSHVNPALVHHAANVLENSGIESLVQGEYAGGGYVGVPHMGWTELWITDENRLQEAVALLAENVDDEEIDEAEPWTCQTCGEELSASFAVCWNCGGNRPETEDTA